LILDKYYTFTKYFPNDYQMTKEIQFLIYNTPQENVKIDVVVKDKTIVRLFDSNRSQNE
jgi:hypothetical protein